MTLSHIRYVSSSGLESHSVDLRTFPTGAAPGPGSLIRSRGPLRAICSFPVVLGMFLVVLVMLKVRTNFNDPDMWFHLKIGEIIWKTHTIPRVDTFSFTVSGHERTPQEWLSEVTMYGAWKFGGYTGLMLWLCALASALILLAYLLSSLYSGNAKVAFLGGLIVFIFSSVGLGVRPHMIGYLLLVCELLVVHLGHTRDWKWFFALPLIFGFWVNFHSSFMFGLVVLAIFLFCSSLELSWGLLVSHRWNGRQRKALAIAFALSIAALFTNPIGWKQVTYPAAVMGSLPLSLHNVAEWLPPSFETFRGLAVLFVAGLILLIPLLRRAELQLDELLLVAIGFGFAVRHERMMFVFGILAAPTFCRLLAGAWHRYDASRDSVLVNSVALALLAPTIVLAFPNSRNLQQQAEEGNPVKAVHFLQHSGLSGRMLNEYAYGGYLIWAAPKRKVFIDGRGDVFEWAGVFADYSKLIMLEDPQSVLRKYDIDYCLLARDQPVARALALLPGWQKIYSDKMSTIFARSGPAAH